MRRASAAAAVAGAAPDGAEGGSSAVCEAPAAPAASRAVVDQRASVVASGAPSTRELLTHGHFSCIDPYINTSMDNAKIY